MSRDVDVCKLMFARFVPGDECPSFRSSRSGFTYTQPDPKITHCWATTVLVVSPGGRELNVMVRVFVRAGKWFVATKLEDEGCMTSAPQLIELPKLDPAAPRFLTAPFDFFGERAAVRLTVEPLL